MRKYGFSMTDKGTVAVPSDVGGFYLASDVDARIAELEKALKPFVEASKHAEAMREFVTQVRRNPVDGVGAYVWWCGRSLCVDDFKQAANALMER